MPGTVRKIIDRIKEQRSGGNSVVALTVETRLVLQGFDPQRFDYDTPDDPGRLARIREVAAEMSVGVDDLLREADAEPDPDATPAPPPGAPTQAGGEGVAAAAQAAAQAAGVIPGGSGRGAGPSVPEDHPLRRFRELVDETLEKDVGDDVEPGPKTGAAFATLVKSSLLIALYSFQSDRVFLDQLRYNSLFQWFLGLRPGETAFDPDAFAADREQALGNQAARHVFDRIVPKAGQQKLFSSPVFQVNSRQIKGWMTQRAGV